MFTREAEKHDLFTKKEIRRITEIIYFIGQITVNQTMLLNEKEEKYKGFVEKLLKRCQEIQTENERCVLR